METPASWGNGQTPPRATDSASRSPLSSLGVAGAGLGLLLAGAAHLKLPVFRPPPQMEVPWECHSSATLGPLSSSTTYMVRVTCLYPGGSLYPDWPPDHT